jgi:hypothetical protein
VLFFIEAIKREPGISSVQITFHEDLAPELHAIGFRLAVINGFDRAVAFAGRQLLKEYFEQVRFSRLG